jgi:cysteine sulfinate desulfinase/cysteine desulfurase-like protein
LLAMGIEPSLADCSIRVSLGHSTTKKDLDSFLNVIANAYSTAVRGGANQKAI